VWSPFGRAARSGSLREPVRSNRTRSVEHLVAVRSVEALDESVLIGLPWLDEAQLDAPRSSVNALEVSSLPLLRRRALGLP
jgi:hypothetical protein